MILYFWVDEVVENEVIVVVVYDIKCVGDGGGSFCGIYDVG